MAPACNITPLVSPCEVVEASHEGRQGRYVVTRYRIGVRRPPVQLFPENYLRAPT